MTCHNCRSVMVKAGYCGKSRVQRYKCQQCGKRLREPQEKPFNIDIRIAPEKVTMILHCLAEGNSVRATSRLCDRERRTVLNLLLTAGHHCQSFMDRTICFVTVEKLVQRGNPDLSKAGTSHIERRNGSLCKWCKRLTRLTYASSRKEQNLQAALACTFGFIISLASTEHREFPRPCKPGSQVTSGPSQKSYPHNDTTTGLRWSAMDLLRFNGAVERDVAIDAWMDVHAGTLGEIARGWFEAMRNCGDEVRELLHDGCPVACLGDAPFGYVNVFTSHVNVGFFRGASLADPARLLQGSGKLMRHVKLRLGMAVDAAALGRLIEMAYADIKSRVESG